MIITKQLSSEKCHNYKTTHKLIEQEKTINFILGNSKKKIFIFHHEKRMKYHYKNRTKQVKNQFREIRSEYN